MNVVDARATVSREATTTDRMSHIVQDRDKVRRALLEGLPVRALCGRIWVPKRWKPADTPTAGRRYGRRRADGTAEPLTRTVGRH